MDENAQTATRPFMSGYVTRQLAATQLRCSTRTVDRMISRGVMRGYRPSGAPGEQVPTMLLGSEVTDVAAVRDKIGRLPTKEDMAAVRPGLGQHFAPSHA